MKPSTNHKKTPEERKDFAKRICNGERPGKAYREATGATGTSADVQAHRWMKLPEIQKLILQETQKGLVDIGILSVKRLKQGLKHIDPKKMTGTHVKMIQLGMQMSGLLDKKIDLNVTETHKLAPEVLAALEGIGRNLLEGGQTLEQEPDRTYAVKGEPGSAAAPADS